METLTKLQQEYIKKFKLESEHEQVLINIFIEDNKKVKEILENQNN